MRLKMRLFVYESVYYVIEKSSTSFIVFQIAERKVFFHKTIQIDW